MSYIVSCSEDQGLKDYWFVFNTLSAAQKHLRELSEKDGMYCWAISQVVAASEPHWVGSHDPEIETALDEAFAAVFRKEKQNDLEF